MKKNNSRQELVRSVIEDFEARRVARKPLELQWQLNIDFLRGNQNNFITNFGNVAAMGKQFHWQRAEVFNHISPMTEMRLAKLTDGKRQISVVPLSDSEHDIKCAQICDKIVKSAFKKVDMNALIDQANMWSEMTGTAFYKVVWNNNGGRLVGEIKTPVLADGGTFLQKGEIFEGDVQVIVCSPFEIYPGSLTSDIIQDVIHAKPYSVEAIREIWGVSVEGEDIEVFDFNRTAPAGGASVMPNAAMVVERYKNGKLVIVAGDKLLFEGTYGRLPFIRQTSESMPGAVFGKSVIERAIPVQRAYNAVKNRKTEFLNRLACGVVAVEDGSVDIEALENDGLAPGTVIVYRQGTQPPTFVNGAGLPEELEREEERLLREFTTITGGTDIFRGTESTSISGVALEIITEQDKLRIRRAIASGQNAVAAVAGHILRLYKQYVGHKRLERLVDGKCVQMFTWDGDDITSDEVIYE